jgi:hypothetical protein
MLQAWKSIGAATCAGYIIGFPNDTRERVLRDIEIIKRELPVDLVEFFCLTPLPGSEDHKILDAKGVWMDPDMNNYDTEHVTTAHALMSAEEFMATYREAWHAFYTPQHIETVLRRAAASGLKPSKVLGLLLYFYGSQAIEGIHPLQGGLFRRKYRTDRRSGMPIENPFVFYPRYLWEIVSKTVRVALFVNKYKRICRRVENDPARYAYTDLALTPAVDEDLDTLEMFSNTTSAIAAADKARARAARAAKSGKPATPATIAAAE